MNRRPQPIYKFGPFRLDPIGGRLSRDGKEVALRSKLFRLLVVLVERCGQVVEKDELLHLVWGDTTVEENNLTVSINALRRVLGDEHYIETVARRGYRFVPEVEILYTEDSEPLSDAVQMEPPGGALPLQSRLYISRHSDDEFYTAIGRQDSIVLVKGPRQVGKTSLLARGLQRMREMGAAVVVTDLQHLTTTAFESIEKLLLALAELIADQLELPTAPNEVWKSYLSPSSNFERYLRREVLIRVPTSFIWGLDEVDRLFNFNYASDFFGLVRSWHNLRALDPAGPWYRLTLALAYATEAHLFITDLNQSPFNVGTRLTLEDFTLEQTAELNGRLGSPLQAKKDIERFYQLVGGHPYLTQCGLYELVRGQTSLAIFEGHTDHSEGPFADHLRRMMVSLERDTALSKALFDALRGEAKLSVAHFYRLRSAGILSGDSPQDARMRCELYDRFFRRQLP